MKWTALPYSSIDLVAFTDEMARAEELSLDEDRFGGSAEILFRSALLQYEKELDRQLRRLIAIEADEPNGARAYGRTTLARGFDDPEDRGRWRARVGEASVRLAELQRRHAGLVGYYLTAERRVSFDAHVMASAYPITARSSGPEALIDRLLAMHEASRVQRDQILLFKEDYREERGDADRALMRAIDALVATGDVRVTSSFEPIRNGWGFGAEIPEAIELQRQYRERRLLDSRWSGRIWRYAVEQDLVTREKSIPDRYLTMP